ncbi:hypothetical protein DTO212C5_4029 [Paecilomyces variotii]|nr:hypothetical protein DTO169C6_5364 [Paecilomyces variotii]KAJ9269855.1 hypothetical protein DTO212C5_4029 [Paecilomyces variotii]
MSSSSTPLSTLKPIYPPPSSTPIDPTTQPEQQPSILSTITTLNLTPHIEGGYFTETDRSPLNIPNPFLSDPNLSYAAPSNATTRLAPGQDNTTRSASTTIYYFLTPGTPLGAFHRNRGRTVHTLHWGRGRYVLIHADEVMSPEGKVVEGKKARIETFVVGKDIQKGEKVQWIVEGGKYKASYLLPDQEGDEEKRTEGLLISETVVPGFEFADHDFMLPETMEELLTPEQVEELKWMLRKGA